MLVAEQQFLRIIGYRDLHQRPRFPSPALEQPGGRNREWLT